MGATTPISRRPRARKSKPSAEQNPRPQPVENDLWIFRAGERTVAGPAMLRELSRAVSGIHENPALLLDAVIEAGQLEAALGDAGLAGAEAASQLTDSLALMVSGHQGGADALELSSRIAVPDALRLSPPEGFTYYALHPLDFVRITERVPAKPKACAVIGIRSIGTTLSALTVAGLTTQGRKAARITVRPTGHPYCRTIEFTAGQLGWIRQQIVESAQFLIVDEGPGRSGSTFLSVAEALVAAGVPQAAITILGSRSTDPDALCAERAASRWSAFRFLSTVPSQGTRFEGFPYIGGGAWRNFFFASPADWPESWIEMERLKFLSPDGRTFFKFEGMGQLGCEIRERALLLAKAGFSPSVSDAGGGFLAYERLDGKLLTPADASAAMLERMARYCAFRASSFSTLHAAPHSLREMIQFNVRQQFGRELPLADDQLVTEYPVVADGRMQPHEWIAVGPEHIVKTDAISHGDDHFFPGPCDIAWDLAGASVEWQLSRDALAFLIDRFRRLSGMNVTPDLDVYMLAYSVFRLGFSKMAISRAGRSVEDKRLAAAYGRYRAEAARLLEKLLLSRTR
jgi:hypothetical protein